MSLGLDAGLSVSVGRGASLWVPLSVLARCSLLEISGTTGEEGMAMVLLWE